MLYIYKIKELKQEKQYFENEAKILKQKLNSDVEEKGLKNSGMSQTISYYLEKIERLESENASLKNDLEICKREMELARSVHNKSIIH